MSNIIDLREQLEMLRSLNEVDRQTPDYLLKEGLELLASYVVINDPAIRSEVRGLLATLAKSREGTSR